MKRVISWLQSIKLRQVITVFFVSLTFFVSSIDIAGNLQAQAEPITPEAKSYQVDNTDQQVEAKAEQIQDRIEENAEKSAKLLEKEGIEVTNRAAEVDKDPNKGFFESVKEKLNLDEPIDPGTKKAVKQAKDAVVGD